MRLTQQVLGSRAEGADLADTEYLDLAELAVVGIEQLHHCPKLAYLDLSHNRLETVENLEPCCELWHINLSNNRIRTLDGLCRFPLLGSLALSSNQLEWQALKRIQHIHIVDLHLQGNPRLQEDVHYRIHAVDSLPNVWMLDGIMVTTCERQRVSKFFKDHSSRADLRPVHRKLPSMRFVPSNMKKLLVNGIFGQRAKMLTLNVPLSAPQSTEVDWCRLRYIMKMFSGEVKIVGDHSSVVSYASISSASLAGELLPNLDDLLNQRHEHLEQSNMLLLLLVVSLEFSLPARVIESALETVRLVELGKVRCMQLFLLEKRLRCRLCGILFSAAVLDRDSGEKEALYSQLYNALRSIVTSLTYKAFCGVDGALAEQHRQHSLPASEHDFGKHRQLLAAEVVQLFCLVPSFFDLLGNDSGVLELATVATGDGNLRANIMGLQEELRWDKVDRWQIYQRLAAYLLLKVKSAMDAAKAKPQLYSRHLSQTRKGTAKTNPSAPGLRRPKSSPSGKVQSTYISKHRVDRMASASTVISRHQGQPMPRVGDYVLIQYIPRVLGQILSFTESNAAVIAVQRVPSLYEGRSTEHLLIDLEPLVYDAQGYWKPVNSDMVGARQRTWQSADALAMNQRGVSPEYGDGRFSPAPPPSSPHHSLLNSVCDVTMGDQTHIVDGDDDSDTGTESGDESESGGPKAEHAAAPPTSPAASAHTAAANGGGGGAVAVRHKPRLSPTAPPIDVVKKRKERDEFALQAHVEMVIQHLQDTGLSKHAGHSQSTTAHKVPTQAAKSLPIGGPPRAAAVASSTLRADGRRHDLRPIRSVSGVVVSRSPQISVDRLPTPSSSNARRSPAKTATVRHSMDSTIPAPCVSTGSGLGQGNPMRPESGPTPDRGPPSQSPQLATRTVTMAFQSRPGTGRHESWNTVHHSPAAASSAVSRRARTAHNRTSQPHSVLVGSIPVTVALDISQHPGSGSGRFLQRQQAWRHPSGTSRGARTSVTRSLGAIPSSHSKPFYL